MTKLMNMDNDNFEYKSSHRDKLKEFFKSPTKDNFPQILDHDKEYDALEFKQEWHEKSKLAKHILAFANSGGGAIVYGVEENDDESFDPIGLSDIRDEADFGDKIEKYIPDSAHAVYMLETYPYNDHYNDAITGKTFQVIFVDGANETAPLVSTNGGDSIDEGMMYIRRNTKSTRANHEEIQALLEQRLESGLRKTTAELHEELRELKTLYEEVQKNSISMPVPSTLVTSLAKSFRESGFESERNPNYPKEDYEEFISKLIDKKKKRIEARIGVNEVQL